MKKTKKVIQNNLVTYKSVIENKKEGFTYTFFLF